MNQQIASLGGFMNSLKWFIALGLIALGVLGNHYYSEQSLLIRSAGLLALAAVVAFIFSLTHSGKQFWRFAQEAKSELRRVVWPNRKETIQTTAMVLAVVAIVGIILWGVDILLLKMVAWITGYGA